MERRTISPGFIEDALDCLRQQGIAAGPVMRAAGLPQMVTEPVSSDRYGALWLAMAAESQDEFFGLGARPMRPGSFALMCHAVMDTRSLEHALRRMLRFLRIVLDDPSGRLNVQDGQAEITLTTRQPRTAFAYRTYWLIVMGLACWLIGRRIPLRRVDFACPAPEHREDYHQFFGAPVHFGQPVSRLVIAASYLDLPVIREPQALAGFLRGAPANILVRYRHDQGLTARIRNLLQSRQACNWPGFEDLAASLGLAPATLRRRLRAEGQSVAEIKDDIRNVRAQNLLRFGDSTISEIAADLGYSEASAFHRAFRKWTGTSPGAFRQARMTSGKVTS